MANEDLPLWRLAKDLQEIARPTPAIAEGDLGGIDCAAF
jgi:hypothetical protein